MNWLNRFFNKNNNDNYQIIKNEIPFSTLTRWYLYDLSIPDPNDIAVELGLNPVSDEGHDMEEQDSEKRLEELEPLLPYLDILSELNAKIITNMQLSELKKHRDIDIELENDAEVMQDLYYAVGFSALVSAFSSALELGIIYPNAIGVGSVFKEHEDEQ